MWPPDDVPAAALAVIDMSDAALSDHAGRREAADRFVECFTTAGVCLITGLEGHDEEELLRWTRDGRSTRALIVCLFQKFNAVSNLQN